MSAVEAIVLSPAEALVLSGAEACLPMLAIAQSGFIKTLLVNYLRLFKLSKQKKLKTTKK